MQQCTCNRRRKHYTHVHMYMFMYKYYMNGRLWHLDKTAVGVDALELDRKTRDVTRCAGHCARVALLFADLELLIDLPRALIGSLRL